MIDPTYVGDEIRANPVWALAFQLSEQHNDDAPIGWSRYISMAMWLMKNFDMTPREPAE